MKPKFLQSLKVGAWLMLSVAVLGGSALAQTPTGSPAKEPSVEDRLADLEAYVNNSARQTEAPSKIAGPGPGHNAWQMTATALEIGRAHVELQSLMRISYAVFCLKKKNKTEAKTYRTK